jgi:hypothetical protein
MTDAIIRLMTMKQQDNESLMDYVKRFKQNRDVLRSHLGTQWLEEFVGQQSFYLKADLADRGKIEDDAFGQLMAYLLIRFADPNKYGSLQKHLASQYSLGHDQYPKTILLATDALSQHRFDPKYYEVQKKNRDRDHQKPSQNKDSETSKPDASFAQKGGIICATAAERKDISVLSAPRRILFLSINGMLTRL